MELLSNTIMLFMYNCFNSYEMLTSSSWMKNYIIGSPQPTETYTVEQLRNDNFVGLYQSVTEEGIVKLSNDSNRAMHVFDWVGDYPNPEFYKPQFLTYTQVDGSLIVSNLSESEYRNFIDTNYTVLPALKSGRDNVGLYRKRKLV